MTLKRKHMIAAIGGAMTMTAIMTVPVHAQTTTKTTKAAKEESIFDTEKWETMAAANVESYAIIRKGSSVETEQIGVLLPGRAVTIEGEENGWKKISSGDVKGYIREDLLVYGEEAKEHYKNVCGIVGTVDAEGLRIRELPSTEARILGTAKNSSKVKVVGEQDDWYEVEYGGDTAYMYAEYIELSDEVLGAMTVAEYKESKATSAAVSAGSSDMALMAALIECEAGGESYTGKVAVGAVVLNRLRSSSFPNTLSGVIYQRGQFTPAMTGKLARVLARGARSDCYQAAAAAFAGENPIGGCLYFNSGRGRGIQIGNQHFY